MAERHVAQPNGVHGPHFLSQFGAIRLVERFRAGGLDVDVGFHNVAGDALVRGEQVDDDRFDGVVHGEEALLVGETFCYGFSHFGMNHVDAVERDWFHLRDLSFDQVLEGDLEEEVVNFIKNL